MSYELHLYISKPLPLDPPPATTGGQFVVHDAVRLEDDDIPDAYLALLGKRRRWRIEIYIEGQHSRSALAAFESWLVDAVHRTNGVLIDEQADRYQTPRITARLPAESGTDHKTAQSMGQMTFFFENHDTYVDKVLPRVLDCLSEILPEALPHRYGAFEPLQGKMDGGDTAPLLAAFVGEPSLIMKARTPFGFIHTSLASNEALKNWHPNHFIKRHFIAGRVSFDLRPSAFELPHLTEAFWTLARVFDVFYAELRSSDCPVRAWFWKGLPDSSPRAFVLGPPYTGHWAEAAAQASDRNGDFVLVAPTRLSPDLPPPPAALVDPGKEFVTHGQNPGAYAEVFPFKVPNLRQ